MPLARVEVERARRVAREGRSMVNSIVNLHGVMEGEGRAYAKMCTLSVGTWWGEKGCI